MNWSEQTVLVTGGSRGIGRSIAVAFARLGCRVAINYVSNEAQAQETLKLCNSEKARIYRADVSNEADVTEMIKKIEADLGPVGILINNAGIIADGLLMTMSTENWRKVMSTHLDGAFFCSRAVLPSMLQAKRGRIINMSSVSGIKGTAGQCNYSAAKAGLVGFTKALAREMGKKNITSNALALGVIETEMSQTLDEDALKAYRQMTSLKRFGSAEEVAGIVTFLASPAADYITGQVINVDGGIL